MNDVLYTNIFFIIASFGTVLFVIFVTIILWQILKLVKTIRSIVERVERASDIVAEDMTEFRASVKSGMIGKVINWFINR